MTETLPRLLALQACDQCIQQVTHTLSALQQALATLREEEQTRTQDIQILRHKLRAAEQTREALTLQIAEDKEHLRDKKYALHRRRADQLDGALRREVALLEAHKAALEEDLHTLMDQITQDAATLRQAEALAPAQQEETRRITSSLLGQITATKEDLRVAQETRRTLATTVNAFLLQEYERIFLHRGGVAVVALAHATCQGCHMNVPPQMCLELQTRAGLTFCPHCHRILFATTEARLVSAAASCSYDTVNSHRVRQSQR